MSTKIVGIHICITGIMPVSVCLIHAPMRAFNWTWGELGHEAMLSVVNEARSDVFAMRRYRPQHSPKST